MYTCTGISAFLLKFRVPFRPWLEPGALSCCPATPSCCVPPGSSQYYTDVRALRGSMVITLPLARPNDPHP